MVLEYIKKAYKIYEKNFLDLVVMNFVILLISGIIFFIGFIPILFLLVSSATGMTSSLTLLSTLFSPGGIAVLAFASIFFFIAILVSWVLQGSFVRVIYESLHGKVKWETLWKTAKQKYKTLIGANFLRSLIISIPVAIILLPFFLSMMSITTASSSSALVTLALSAFFLFIGIIIVLLVSLLFLLVDQTVVIDNANALEAVKKSFKIAKNNYIPLLALVVLYALASMLISLIPYIGGIIAGIFITPLMLISYTIFYLEKRRK